MSETFATKFEPFFFDALFYHAIFARGMREIYDVLRDPPSLSFDFLTRIARARVKAK